MPVYEVVLQHASGIDRVRYGHRRDAKPGACIAVELLGRGLGGRCLLHRTNLEACALRRMVLVL